MTDQRRGATDAAATTIAHLPAALMATVLLKLDVPSLCAIAATCRFLRDCAAQALFFLPSFHLLEVSPPLDLLRHLLPPNPYLRSLKLDCRRLDDSAIVELSRPSLEELTLFNCFGLSGRLLVELARRCRYLRSLAVSSLAEKKGRCFTLSELQEMLLGCPLLESLSLAVDMSQFSSQDFTKIWTTTPLGRLSALEISYIPSATARDLLGCAALHSLQKLALSVNSVSDAIVAAISNSLVSLTHLDLQDAPMAEPSAATDLTNSGLLQSNKRGKLKHLSLVRSHEHLFAYFKGVNDLGFLLLADVSPNLESIRLGGFCRVTDTGFRAILHSCPKLCKLKVSHGSQLTDLLFHDMAATSLCLTHVSLRRCNLITDMAVASLATNKDLTVLDLRDSRHVGDQAIKAIADLPKLQVLLLDGTDISDWGLARLGSRSRSLISVSARGCRRISDGGIPRLLRRSMLETLQAVDLSRSGSLSDEGILLLARSGAAITELRLRECTQIGDVAVMALASMRMAGEWLGSTLRLLDLYECRAVTAMAFRWFKKPYFPRLRWLGLTMGSNWELVEDLVRSRPLLNVACSGKELGGGLWEGGCHWYGHPEEFDQGMELEEEEESGDDLI
ncbi:F-box/RNI-like superfamily protein [Wolffia australiana]